MVWPNYKGGQLHRFYWTQIRTVWSTLLLHCQYVRWSTVRGDGGEYLSERWCLFAMLHDAVSYKQKSLQFNEFFGKTVGWRWTQMSTTSASASKQFDNLYWGLYQKYTRFESRSDYRILLTKVWQLIGNSSVSVLGYTFSFLHELPNLMPAGLSQFQRLVSLPFLLALHWLYLGYYVFHM